MPEKRVALGGVAETTLCDIGGKERQLGGGEGAASQMGLLHPFLLSLRAFSGLPTGPGASPGPKTLKSLDSLTLLGALSRVN